MSDWQLVLWAKEKEGFNWLGQPIVTDLSTEIVQHKAKLDKDVSDLTFSSALRKIKETLDIPTPPC